MITILPISPETSPSSDTQSLLIDLREKLCRPCCINSENRPEVAVRYSNGTPVVSGNTLFIPITATITFIVPGCKCLQCGGNKSTTQIFTENFTVAFQGRTTIPTVVTIRSTGHIENYSDIKCCKCFGYVYKDAITINLT